MAAAMALSDKARTTQVSMHLFFHMRISPTGYDRVGQGSDYPSVNALAIDANGRVYVGGDFINVAGIAAADYVAMWNPSIQRWSALGSNSSGDGAISGEYVDVSALAIDANGRVYAGGDFDNLAGIAAADSVAVWDPATGQWSALGNGLQSEYSHVAALAVDAKDRVYIGGLFRDGGGNAAADALVVWDSITQTWGAVGSDGNGDGAILYNTVNAIAIDSRGKLYIGGSFENVANDLFADFVAAYQMPDVFRVFVPAINR